MENDAFQKNIDGVSNLVEAGVNKTAVGSSLGDSLASDYEDVLTLKKSDEELLALESAWQGLDDTYTPKIKPRQSKNKKYYLGRQWSQGTNDDSIVSSNLIFEAEETFIPQALSQNPEPVVWSDNTEEGMEASNDIKTMMQYHADTLGLRRKLGVMVRHWSIYFTGIVKHGWSKELNDISLDVRKPENFMFDPDGYVDELGNYHGRFLGEKIKSSASDLSDLYPEHKAYITVKTDGKLGTQVIRKEWWTNEYCFVTFGGVVLDKFKNPYFNYKDESSEEGQLSNHFAKPKMPYTFLSVFSLQEQPHDDTTLVEQAIPNQDRITERDNQITKNLKHANNSIALSGTSFEIDTAKQAADALEKGDPVLVPDGDVNSAIARFPAPSVPDAVFRAQETDKITLRSVFGTQGLTAQPQKSDTTARGMILNQSHDASRIGGGIGDALEQVADNIFNWWLQLYNVFYDEPHYGAVMGNGRAVTYVQIINSNLNRNFVVSVAPNSMQPKDEISEQNLAITLANNGWLDPINLFKKLNYPDPMETARQVTMWKVAPQQYLQTYFPQEMMNMAGGMGNPPNMPPIQNVEQQTLGNPPASPSLSQVPINTAKLPT